MDENNTHDGAGGRASSEDTPPQMPSSSAPVSNQDYSDLLHRTLNLTEKMWTRSVRLESLQEHADTSYKALFGDLTDPEHPGLIIRFDRLSRQMKWIMAGLGILGAGILTGMVGLIFKFVEHMLKNSP